MFQTSAWDVPGQAGCPELEVRVGTFTAEGTTPLS